LQAGGRRFDPVWLHQAALQVEAADQAALQKLVRGNFQSATAGFLSGAGVMSDIVKRRSIRAFGAAVKVADDALSPIRNRNSGISYQKASDCRPLIADI
jgi:hypothetical protein